MKLINIEQVNSFLGLIDKCRGDVWLESREGDQINLRSKLSQYVAIGALLSNHGEELELYCQLPEDESKFYDWFNEHEDAL